MFLGLNADTLNAGAVLPSGGEWADFNPSSTWPRRQRVLTYGSNRLHIPKPSFIQVMWIELKNPLIVIPVR